MSCKRSPGQFRARVLLCCFLGSLSMLVQGCSVFEPIVASGEYEVKAPGGAVIEVQLHGGDGVSRVRQVDVIQDYMLDLSRDPKRESAAFDAMLDLETLFESQGFPIAQVERQVVHDKGRTRVAFEITQGPRVVLDELRLVGNKSVDRETLLGYWSRLGSQVLGFGDNLYVASEIEALGGSITSHYRRLGYLDVQVNVGAPQPALSSKTTHVKLTIEVLEGTRYRLGKIEIDPKLAAAFGADGPKAPAGGSPFVSAEIQDFALRIAQYLRQHGHADPVVRRSVSTDQKTHTVTVTLEGDPGSRVKVKQVLVRGQSFTSERVIRRRIDIPPGELFDGKKEDASLLRLYQSGLFRKIDVQHEPAGPGEINIVFDLEQAKRYLIELMAGYGSYEQLRGGLEFGMLSVLGSGFDLNTKATASMRGHRIVASLADSQFMPDLLGHNTTFSITGDTFRRMEPSFTDAATGISPSVSHRFSNRLSTRAAYVFREHNNLRSSVLDPAAKFTAYTEGSALLELAYDSRDNPLVPKTGTRIAAQYKHYDDFLGGDVQFDRVRMSVGKLLPLSRSTRLVLNAEAWWLFPQDSTTPIQERVFNGGDSSVRSFREDKLAPDDLLDVTGQVTGGEYSNTFNMELRWAPPIRLMRTIDFELALFSDAGNLGKSVHDYGLSDMKYALGAGLRFILPIGPVRFDMAYNPDRLPREREWTFHFSIGYPF